MKLKISGLALVVALSFFAIGRLTADTNRTTLHQKTLENLATAMHGEAFAYAKYMLYSHHARQHGNAEVADLFRNAAQTERFEHFAEEAKLAALVGTDAENLNDALRSETNEVTSVYAGFVQQAIDVGDDVAALRFEDIRADEMRHRDNFKAALDKLEAKPVEKKMNAATARNNEPPF